MLKNDPVLITLLVLAFVLTAALVAVNVLTMPAYPAPTVSALPQESLPPPEVPAPSAPAASEAAPAGTPAPDFPLDLNRATAAELEEIPDIGPVTAANILEYRGIVGTIVTFEELLSIDGIGEKTLVRLREYCVIG